MEEDFSDWTGIERRMNPRENNIVIVRHAESVANTKGIYQGQTYDTDLSELGKKQAKALAERLKVFGAKRIITSPLKRTYQTAQAIAKETGLQIEINKKIIETNHGEWEGKHKVWVKENFADVHETWLTKPSETVFPAGEAYMDTVKRTLDFLETTEFDPDTVVITHDNILRAMISLINNTDIDKMWEIPTETAALNVFEVNKVNLKNMFRILKLNDIDHLGSLRNSIRTHAL